MRTAFFFVFIIFFAAPGSAQIGEFIGDEKTFYAATKQVNQFLRRFNGEEDLLGKRYHVQDTNYRNPELRSKYIKILFDNKQQSISPDLKHQFLTEVLDSKNPQFLDLHGGNWFAQVNAKFSYKGRNETLQLFLRLQEEPVGSKWVIYKAYFEPLKEYFDIDTAAKNKFIHPMSHELDFMNLRKIFDDPDIIPAYTNREFRPDYLSLMLYEIKRGNLKFSTVNTVKFHFFQLDQWYFELTEFNRLGSNTGWLISNLLHVDLEQKEKLRRFIYYGER